MIKSKALLLIVLLVLLAFSSVQVYASSEYISILRTDFVTLKGLYNQQTINLNKANEQLKDLNNKLLMQMELSTSLQNQLQSALNQASNLMEQFNSLKVSTTKLETFLINTTRQNELLKLSMKIIIPVFAVITIVLVIVAIVLGVISWQHFNQYGWSIKV